MVDGDTTITLVTFSVTVVRQTKRTVPVSILYYMLKLQEVSYQ